MNALLLALSMVVSSSGPLLQGSTPCQIYVPGVFVSSGVRSGTGGSGGYVTFSPAGTYFGTNQTGSWTCQGNLLTVTGTLGVWGPALVSSSGTVQFIRGLALRSINAVPVSH